MERREDGNVGTVRTDTNSNDVGVKLRDKVCQSDVEEGNGGKRGFLGGKSGEGGRGGAPGPAPGRRPN